MNTHTHTPGLPLVSISDAITTHFKRWDDVDARSYNGFAAFAHSGCGFIRFAWDMLPETVQALTGRADFVPLVCSVVDSLRADPCVNHRIDRPDFDTSDDAVMVAGVLAWLDSNRGGILETIGEKQAWIAQALPGYELGFEVESCEAPAIMFDFASAYYSGMYDPMYRVGCGTFYVSDIPMVARRIEEANDEYHNADDKEHCYGADEDESWFDILMSCEDEIYSLKREYKEQLEMLAWLNIS